MKPGHKTLWIAVLLSLALPLTLRAQGLSGGISGGLSLATLSGDDASDDLDYRKGLVAGAFLDLPLGEIIGVTSGLYYVQKGFSQEVGGDDVALKLDYLEVPVLLRVSVAGGEAMGISVFLGPTLGFQMKCEGEADQVSADCDVFDFPGSDFDPSKSFDLGAAFGAGLAFALSGGTSILANAVYDIGLTSIDDSTAERDVKNEAILLQVGLGFNVGQ